LPKLTNGMKSEEKPKIGMGVMIKKGGKILIGKRKNSHGDGTWAFPGGHLENGESFSECLKREIKEECAIDVKNLRFQCVANIIKYGKHYVLIGYVADWKKGEPKLMEPDKCEGWEWFDLKNLPSPLFEASKIIIESYRARKDIGVKNAGIGGVAMFFSYVLAGAVVLFPYYFFAGERVVILSIDVALLHLCCLDL